MHNNSQVYFSADKSNAIELPGLLYFLTFANNNYMSTQRIANEAKSFKMFDFIVSKSDTDISDYLSKHSDFIRRESYGFGRFIWKPKVIFDLLESVNDDDIILYSDAGTHFNVGGIERFHYYLSTILKDKEMCVFSSNDKYKPVYFCKSDCIMSYYPDFHKDIELYPEVNKYCYAGLLLIRKTPNTVQLVREWLSLCENYHFLDCSSSNIYPEKSHFVGQDADNGILNICLVKFKNIVNIIYPDEVCLYVGDKQVHQTNTNLNTLDWSLLNDKPFQCRRMTPKFNFT